MATTLNPKVRQTLTLFDLRASQEGMPTYPALETALDEARQFRDLKSEADVSLQMGTRLSAIATVAEAIADSDRDLGGFPTAADALEPAVDLFARTVEIAVSQHNDAQEKFARNRLAACYVQSREFAKALEHLKRALDLCHMPDDAALRFDTAQQIGDCYYELENDAAALSWYQQGLDIAKEIDDPFEVTVQLGKIASALTNVKRYDEALANFAEARDLLRRIGEEPELQQKVTIHKNLFSVTAIPGLIAYNEQRMQRTQEALGRDLLRDGPDWIGAIAAAALTDGTVPEPSDWPVLGELDRAIRAAITDLSNLLGPAPDGQTDPGVPDEATLTMVGAFARRHVDQNARDPESLTRAARYLIQIDRSRRAALHLRDAESSAALPGPFGGGTSGHVLYLRSFVASPHLPRVVVEPWGLLDLEELLACRLDRSPLIALGNPELERFGPGRAQTTDKHWRKVLRALAMEAQMLLVIPAQTQGTSWEIEWVVTNKFLHKTCFVMPPPGPGDETWWADTWRELKTWSARLGVNLPEYTPQGCLFRLTSEGLLDTLEFSAVYHSTNLRMTLLTSLLFRLNISFDFLYGMQQGLEQKRATAGGEGSETSTEARAKAVAGDDVRAEDLSALAALESIQRLELSNWAFDEPQIPRAPGVLIYFETPFRMLWAEEVSNLQEALTQHSEGVASDFTRALFHRKVLNLLRGEVDQLLTGSLTIKSIMSFRVKQMVSYRFLSVSDARVRASLVDLIWKGASKHGAPVFPRPTATS